VLQCMVDWLAEDLAGRAPAAPELAAALRAECVPHQPLLRAASEAQRGALALVQAALAAASPGGPRCGHPGQALPVLMPLAGVPPSAAAGAAAGLRWASAAPLAAATAVMHEPLQPCEAPAGPVPGSTTQVEQCGALGGAGPWQRPPAAARSAGRPRRHLATTLIAAGMCLCALPRHEVLGCLGGGGCAA
jgi:hypothetical protein